MRTQKSPSADTCVSGQKRVRKSTPDLQNRIRPIGNVRYLIVHSEAGNFLSDVLRRRDEMKTVSGTRQHASCTFNAEGEHKKAEKHPHSSAVEAVLAAAHITAHQLDKAACTVADAENLTIVRLRQGIRRAGRQLCLAADTDGIRRSTMHTIPKAKRCQQKKRGKVNIKIQLSADFCVILPLKSISPFVMPCGSFCVVLL